MMTRIFVASSADRYVVRTAGPQRSVLESALLFMRDRRELDHALKTRVGCSRAKLSELYEQIKSGEESSLSIDDLHTIHSVLLSVCSLFASEEDFYIKIGFFRENVLALANALAKAVGETEP
ncbi:hypothetical protein [Amycolatopsis sp. NPDC059657]|uniref:hypothetical protein n=1 Tax=Amycolatopsis sp. NPDC059657 TaxID=3346899 RepID=UPI003671E75F